MVHNTVVFAWVLAIFTDLAGRSGTNTDERDQRLVQRSSSSRLCNSEPFKRIRMKLALSLVTCQTSTLGRLFV